VKGYTDLQAIKEIDIKKTRNQDLWLHKKEAGQCPASIIVGIK